MSLFFCQKKNGSLAQFLQCTNFLDTFHILMSSEAYMEYNTFQHTIMAVQGTI
jgi:hypothetical protein